MAALHEQMGFAHIEEFICATCYRYTPTVFAHYTVHIDLTVMCFGYNRKNPQDPHKQ